MSVIKTPAKSALKLKAFWVGVERVVCSPYLVWVGQNHHRFCVERGMGEVEALAGEMEVSSVTFLTPLFEIL
jgi:hypothetical protein